MLCIPKTKAGSKWAQTLATSCIAASGNGQAVGSDLCPDTLCPLHTTGSTQVPWRGESPASTLLTKSQGTPPKLSGKGTTATPG